MFVNLCLFLLVISEVKCGEFTGEWYHVEFNDKDPPSDPNAVGEDVTEATVVKLETTLSYLPYDYTLLSRIALVETTYGEKTDIMQANPTGGIWQVSEAVYTYVRDNVNSSTEGTKILNDLEEKFGFSCFLCQYDFSTPLKSASIARLFIELKLGLSIPYDPAHQATWWRSNYHGGSNPPDYEEIVREKESDYTMEEQTDMYFVVDGGETVANDIFQGALRFCDNMAARCVVDRSETQCGVLVYSENQGLMGTRLNETSDFDDFKQKTLSIQKPEGERLCGNAITRVVGEGFLAAANDRWTDDATAKKTIILFLDKDCTDDPHPAIDQIEQLGFTLFIIAVGDNVNQTKVANMVSRFDEKNAVFVDNYLELTTEEGRNKVFSSYCTSSSYTEEDVDLICVLLCINFVEEGGMTLGQTEYVRDISIPAAQALVQKRFFIDCNFCKNYTASDKARIVLVYTSSLANPTGAAANIQQFLLSTTNPQTNQEEEQEFLCGEEYKADVWFALVGSPSMNDEEFEDEKNFTLSMCSQFNVAETHVQLGLSVYSYQEDILYDIKSATAPPFYQQTLNSASKLGEKRDVGVAVKEVLLNGFSSGAGARSVEDGVKRTLVVLVNGDSTDDVTAAAELAEEMGVEVFVTAIGDEANATNVEDLASKPKSKHYFAVESPENLTATVVTDILHTVEDSPVDVKTNDTTTMRARPGKKQEIATVLKRGSDIEIVINTTNSSVAVEAFLTIGESTFVNPVMYDAKFLLNNGSGNVYLPSDKLFARHPEITEDEVKLTVGFIPRGRMGLRVAFQNDERSMEDVILGNLRDLVIECEDAADRSTQQCIDEFESKFAEAEAINLDASLYEEATNLFEILKIDVIVEDLERLTGECTPSDANRTACISNIEEKLSAAETANVPRGRILVAIELLERLKNEVIAEAEELMEQCKIALDKTECYNNLEIKLSEATSLNISESQLETPYAALREFQLGSEDPPTSDFQSANNTPLLAAVGGVAALLVTSFLVFAVYKRKNKKVVPIDEGLEVRNNIKLLTNDASQVTANFILLQQLEMLLQQADALDIPREDISESWEVFEQLRHRIDQTRNDLHGATEAAKDAEATMTDLQELEHHLTVAESFKLPQDEMTESYNAAQFLHDRLALKTGEEGTDVISMQEVNNEQEQQISLVRDGSARDGASFRGSSTRDHSVVEDLEEKSTKEPADHEEKTNDECSENLSPGEDQRSKLSAQSHNASLKSGAEKDTFLAEGLPDVEKISLRAGEETAEKTSLSENAADVGEEGAEKTSLEENAADAGEEEAEKTSLAENADAGEEGAEKTSLEENAADAREEEAEKTSLAENADAGEEGAENTSLAENADAGEEAAEKTSETSPEAAETEEEKAEGIVDNHETSEGGQENEQCEEDTKAPSPCAQEEAVEEEPES